MVIDIGHGLAIDETTLQTIVIDAEVVQRELAESSDPADRVVAALAMDDPSLAAAELATMADSGFRATALSAELAQAEGRYEDAVTIYRRLLDDGALTEPRRATALQHLGKALWRSGALDEALSALSRARDLRLALGSPVDQIRSSELALARVRDELSDGRTGP